LNRGAENGNLTSLFKLECTKFLLLRRAALLVGFLAVLLVHAVFPSIAQAQINSNIGSVNLNAVLSTSLTVSAAPGLVNFALPPNGVANGSSAINITTTWALSPAYGRVRVWAYFSSAASALSDGAGDNIPSANVSGSRNGGAFAPFTAAGPFAAASSLRVARFRIRGFNRSGTRTDTLALRINTAGLALPAGTYTGTLNIRVQAV
jgi:hypothetical protein